MTLKTKQILWQYLCDEHLNSGTDYLSFCITKALIYTLISVQSLHDES